VGVVLRPTPPPTCPAAWKCQQCVIWSCPWQKVRGVPVWYRMEKRLPCQRAARLMSHVKSMAAVFTVLACMWQCHGVFAMVNGNQVEEEFAFSAVVDVLRSSQALRRASIGEQCLNCLFPSSFLREG